MSTVPKWRPNYGIGNQLDPTFIQISRALNAIVDSVERLQRNQVSIAEKIKVMCRAIEQEEEALRGAPLTRAALVALSVDSIMKD